MRGACEEYSARSGRRAPRKDDAEGDAGGHAADNHADDPAGVDREFADKEWQAMPLHALRRQLGVPHEQED